MGDEFGGFAMEPWVDGLLQGFGAWWMIRTGNVQSALVVASLMSVWRVGFLVRRLRYLGKGQAVRRVLGGVVFGFLFSYAALVIFGAAPLADVEGTAALAYVLSCHCILPLAVIAGSDKEAWRRIVAMDSENFTREADHMVHVAAGAVVGSWASASLIPLDHDAWYQQWPLPVLVGVLVGSSLGSFLSVLSDSWNYLHYRRRQQIHQS